MPKDPFGEPLWFLHAIADFQRMSTSSFPYRSNQANDNQVHFIDYDIIERVNLAYAKLRQAEPYKVHRVLKNKIDDLTTVSSSLANNLNLSLRSGSDPTPTGGSAASVYVSNAGRGDGAAPTDDATTDLDAMVKSILTNSKYDTPAT